MVNTRVHQLVHGRLLPIDDLIDERLGAVDAARADRTRVVWDAQTTAGNLSPVIWRIRLDLVEVAFRGRVVGVFDRRQLVRWLVAAGPREPLLVDEVELVAAQGRTFFSVLPYVRDWNVSAIDVTALYRAAAE